MTTETSTKLLPCPFCGITPATNGVSIFCGNVDCLVRPHSRMSLEAWNTRPKGQTEPTEGNAKEAERIWEKICKEGEWDIEDHITPSTPDRPSEYNCNVSFNDEKIIGYIAAALQAKENVMGKLDMTPEELTALHERQAKDDAAKPNREMRSAEEMRNKAASICDILADDEDGYFKLDRETARTLAINIRNIPIQAIASLQQAVPVLPEDWVAVRKDVIEFLRGAAALDGNWFGATRPKDAIGDFWWRGYLRTNDCPILTAAEVRRAALEEAAVIADNNGELGMSLLCGEIYIANKIAAAIRALGEKE